MTRTLASRPAPPTDLAELISWAADQHPGAVAQRFQRDGTWCDRTYAELRDLALNLTRGLTAIGVRAGDRVAILCATRPEWTVCDLAASVVGAITVPIYPTSSSAEIGWVLADSGARWVIVENDEHLEKVRSVRAQLPDLCTVVGLDVTAAPDVTLLDDLLLDDLLLPPPVASDAGLSHRDLDQAATIMYTSGTTGNPKGCQISHNNWRAMLDAVKDLTTMDSGDVVYVYLPLAHMFTRMVQLVALETGATLAYTAGDIRQVVSELAEIQPTHLPSVPRLFEKVYDLVTANIATIWGDDVDQLGAVVALGNKVRQQQDRGEAVSDEDATAFADADTQLFALVRDAFGGRVREALTGAAPIAAEILEFFRACGVPVYEAYGMTEATAVISANRPDAVKFGTVGRPVAGVKVRIAADGEICSRSAGTFIGYWGNSAATAELVVDGWLHTGDLGSIDADGYLTVTGRKKDLIITSGGKNLTPANIETALRRCRWIGDIVMCGDRRPYPVALVTLDPDEVGPWAREHGIADDLASLSSNHDLHDLIKQAVDVANADYAPPEQIRDFAILPSTFSVESGELTPTMKVRRAIVTARYAGVLDNLYSPATPGQVH